jgi:hypothetical protein
LDSILTQIGGAEMVNSEPRVRLTLETRIDDVGFSAAAARSLQRIPEILTIDNLVAFTETRLMSRLSPHMNLEAKQRVVKHIKQKIWESGGFCLRPK